MWLRWIRAYSNRFHLTEESLVRSMLSLYRKFCVYNIYWIINEAFSKKNMFLGWKMYYKWELATFHWISTFFMPDAEVQHSCMAYNVLWTSSIRNFRLINAIFITNKLFPMDRSEQIQQNALLSQSNAYHDHDHCHISKNSINST